MDLQGIIVFALALCMVFYAIPRQVRKNYHDGNCGMDPVLMLLPLAIYISRAIFAFNKGFTGSWYLYVPDVVGAIASSVLLLQYCGFFLGGEKK